MPCDQHRGPWNRWGLPSSNTRGVHACNSKAHVVSGWSVRRTILKLFDGQEYKGTVQEIDTELDIGDGVETGLFFRIL
jgi:hypothetical protein